MNKENYYIKNAIQTWGASGKTFCLIDNQGKHGGYIVKVLQEEADSFWLEGGPWETEGGAAWSILNYLDNEK